MGCHANAGMTTPWYCNLVVHAKEPYTFQDVSGPRFPVEKCLTCQPSPPYYVSVVSVQGWANKRAQVW